MNCLLAIIERNTHTWVSSNASDDALWHLGKEKVSRGSRSGKVMGRWNVPACGARFTSPHGYTTSDAPLNINLICGRCRRRLEEPSR